MAVLVEMTQTKTNYLYIKLKWFRSLFYSVLVPILQIRTIAVIILLKKQAENIMGKSEELSIKNLDSISIDGQNYYLSGNKMSGGSSIVYDLTKGKEEPCYVIKICTKVNALSRFEKEISFLKSYKKRDLVKVVTDGSIKYEKGNETTLYRYYVMEKCVPFYVVLKNEKSPLKKLRYYLQLCQSVRNIHLLDIIHRDIKPDNILFNKRINRVVLCDFGIAHFPDFNITKKGERLANANYCAPEQRKKNCRILDKGTDIYAMGLILNEIFTDEIPNGSNYKRISDVYPFLGEIDHIVSRMIQANIDDREKDINTIIYDLQQFISKFKRYKKKQAAFLLSGQKKNAKNRAIADQFLNDYYAIVYFSNAGYDINNINIHYHSNIHCRISTEDRQGELILAKIQDIVQKMFNYESSSAVYNMKEDWELCSEDIFRKMIAYLAPYEHLKMINSFNILHSFGVLKDYHAIEVLSKVEEEVDKIKQIMVDAPIIYLFKLMKELMVNPSFNLVGLNIIPIFTKSSPKLQDEELFCKKDLELEDLKNRIQHVLKSASMVFDENRYTLILTHSSDYVLLEKLCACYATKLKEDDVFRVDIEDMLSAAVKRGRRTIMELSEYDVRYVLNKVIP